MFLIVMVIIDVSTIFANKKGGTKGLDDASDAYRRYIEKALTKVKELSPKIIIPNYEVVNLKYLN